jgi:hypothetical protein
MLIVKLLGVYPKQVDTFVCVSSVINRHILNVPTFLLLEPPPILSVAGRGRLMCMYITKTEPSFSY